MKNDGIFYGHLEYIRYIFHRFGILSQEKSGIPVRYPVLLNFMGFS
jgi:hypothetical protein